ncbi:hypothetical protein EON65_37735 [archaeon]|nr:MAG: hypothetical protein EON65_37735 [archaeon]
MGADDEELSYPEVPKDFVGEGEAGEDELEEHPEEAIPDLPENQGAREFLKMAPKKGLFMPLGKEVKVMQCWRCKAFGHRTGDRECPMRMTGNATIEERRVVREDPMSHFVSEMSAERAKKYERVEELKRLVSIIRQEEAERKERKQERKEKKKERKEKKKRSRDDDELHKKEKKSKH